MPVRFRQLFYVVPQYTNPYGLGNVHQPAMRIFLAGAIGFVGSTTLARLLAEAS